MPPSVTVLDPADAAALCQLQAIYRAAIEPHEQKPPDAIADMLLDARYVVLIARSDAIVTGFAISFVPANADFWLLEYMAVAAGCRSKGVGEALWRSALAQVAARTGGPKACILEVDQAVSGAPADGATQTSLPRRRDRRHDAGGD